MSYPQRADRALLPGDTVRRQPDKAIFTHTVAMLHPKMPLFIHDGHRFPVERAKEPIPDRLQAEQCLVTVLG